MGDWEGLLTIHLENVSLAICGCQQRDGGRPECEPDEFQTDLRNPLNAPKSVAVWTTHHLPTFSASPLLRFTASPLSRPANYASFTMGASWQTPAQKIFIDNHFPSYLTHLEDGKKDDFWHDFADKWFESWPLPEPTPELIGEGTAEKAKKAERAKMVAVSTLH